MEKIRNILYILLLTSIITGCSNSTIFNSNNPTKEPETIIKENNDCVEPTTSTTDFTIPLFDGKIYVEIYNNIPYFTEADYTTEPFEIYSELDSLGRCGIAYANICKDIMPTEERGEIGMIKPSGWHTVKYDCVDGNYLYNRCHLIAFCLAGENANEKNLITGTRFFNVEGMLPFEEKVLDYVRQTNNHVLYRVTPMFSGDNLVADGVLMEAYSIEDSGKGICFNVFVYNVQPGVFINYATGESNLIKIISVTEDVNNEKIVKVILNKNSKKIHTQDCPAVTDIKEYNKEEYSGPLNSLYNKGYTACKMCNPN